MTTVFIVLIGVACGMTGFRFGWVAADRYWKDRIDNRPFSIDTIADLQRKLHDMEVKLSLSSSREERVGFDGATISKPNSSTSIITIWK